MAFLTYTCMELEYIAPYLKKIKDLNFHWLNSCSTIQKYPIYFSVKGQTIFTVWLLLWLASRQGKWDGTLWSLTVCSQSREGHPWYESQMWATLFGGKDILTISWLSLIYIILKIQVLVLCRWLKIRSRSPYTITYWILHKLYSCLFFSYSLFKWHWKGKLLKGKHSTTSDLKATAT